MDYNKKLPSGTEIQYVLVCKTKLWLFSHYIRMEDSSDIVALGRHIHENSYDKKNKNIVINDNIALDFIQSSGIPIIHEVKKDKVLHDYHRIQLQYYLWYAKEILGIWPVSGKLDYPNLRKSEVVTLESKDEERLQELIFRVQEIKAMKKPPKPEKGKICSKCAYYEWCWVI